MFLNELFISHLEIGIWKSLCWERLSKLWRIGISANCMQENDQWSFYAKTSPLVSIAHIKRPLLSNYRNSIWGLQTLGSFSTKKSEVMVGSFLFLAPQVRLVGRRGGCDLSAAWNESAGVDRGAMRPRQPGADSGWRARTTSETPWEAATVL